MSQAEIRSPDLVAISVSSDFASPSANGPASLQRTDRLTLAQDSGGCLSASPAQQGGLAPAVSARATVPWPLQITSDDSAQLAVTAFTDQDCVSRHLDRPARNDPFVVATTAPAGAGSEGRTDQMVVGISAKALGATQDQWAAPWRQPRLPSERGSKAHRAGDVDRGRPVPRILELRIGGDHRQVRAGSPWKRPVGGSPARARWAFRLPCPRSSLNSNARSVSPQKPRPIPVWRQRTNRKERYAMNRCTGIGWGSGWLQSSRGASAARAERTVRDVAGSPHPA